MKRLATTIVVLCLFTGPATGQKDGRADTTFQLGRGWLFELGPEDQPYPDCLAIPGGRACN